LVKYLRLKEYKMGTNTKIRVLCMEDDRATASLIKKRLERKGFSVDCAYDGEQSLEMEKNNPYDVITVDYKMPVHDGLDVVKILNERNASPPIIMVTGKGSESIAVEAMKIGVGDYVVKDVDEGYLDLLPAVIEKAIAVKKMEMEKIETERAFAIEREQLLSIFDSINDVVYVSDVETYKVLYANRHLKELVGHDPVGNLCYKEFQQKDKPCEFCTNKIINKKPYKPYYWEFHNDLFDRNYFITDQMIKWPDGRDVRLEIAIDVTEISKTKDQLYKALKEKDALLREVHHRVKNNFAIISSLINLQINKLDDDKIKEVLIESRQRIKSMAAVHENLYLSNKISDISLKEYLRKLTADLFRIYSSSVNKISLYQDVEDIRLDLDHMIPCGLIVNELVTNSLKYAFPDDFGQIGIIKISVSNKDGLVTISVSDNGIGLPKNFDFDDLSSLGLKLVKILSEEQLGGNFTISNTKGAKFTVRFQYKRKDSDD